MIWYALDATQVECEICVGYRGRSACSLSRAADIETAERQAHSGACAQVTGGVTETLECDRIPATVRRCNQ
ncbi:MAG: hypothetical protein CL933_04635 [Deltaproteobacteria bacterium]|nr:hypothetical protein [Deltaproteobacteria bacterium]